MTALAMLGLSPMALRAFAERTRSREAFEAAAMNEALVARVVPPILDAMSDDELEDMLDAGADTLNDDDSLHRYAMAIQALERAGQLPPSPASFERYAAPEILPMLERANVLQRALTAAIAATRPTTAVDAHGLPRLMELPPPPDLRDPALPTVVARCLFALRRAMVATLAIGELIDRPQYRLHGWRDASIARAARDGFYQGVRLLASIDAASVAEDLVPATDRFDMAAERASAQRRSARLDELAARGRESGERAYPPGMPSRRS